MNTGNGTDDGAVLYCPKCGLSIEEVLFEGARLCPQCRVPLHKNGAAVGEGPLPVEDGLDVPPEESFSQIVTDVVALLSPLAALLLNAKLIYDYIVVGADRVFGEVTMFTVSTHLMVATALNAGTVVLLLLLGSYLGPRVFEDLPEKLHLMQVRISRAVVICLVSMTLISVLSLVDGEYVAGSVVAGLLAAGSIYGLYVSRKRMGITVREFLGIDGIKSLLP